MSLRQLLKDPHYSKLKFMSQLCSLIHPNMLDCTQEGIIVHQKVRQCVCMLVYSQFSRILVCRVQ